MDVRRGAGSGGECSESDPVGVWREARRAQEGKNVDGVELCASD